MWSCSSRCDAKGVHIRMQTMAACMGSVALCASHEGVNVEALGGGQFEVGLLLLGSNAVYLIGRYIGR